MGVLQLCSSLSKYLGWSVLFGFSHKFHNQFANIYKNKKNPSGILIRIALHLWFNSDRVVSEIFSISITKHSLSVYLFRSLKIILLVIYRFQHINLVHVLFILFQLLYAFCAITNDFSIICLLLLYRNSIDF